MRSADWESIKAEYIATDISYQKLCEKYNCSWSILTKLARKEHWVDLRKKRREKTVIKKADAIEKEQFNQWKRLQGITTKLINKIDAQIDQEDVLDKQSLKWLTGALKDIKEIQGAKSPLDLKEQEARIKNLNKAAEESRQENKIEVVFGEGVEDFLK